MKRAGAVRIPSSFTLGAHRWRVRVMDVVDRGDSWGHCDEVAHVIRLARRIKQDDGWHVATKDELIQTFIHEFMHAVLKTIGRDEEALVVGCENMIWQALTTVSYRGRR